MRYSSSRLDAGLKKLELFLVAMTPGEELNLPRAMKITGLAREACDAALDALTRAGALVRLQSDAYIRSEGPTVAIDQTLAVGRAAF